MGAPETAERVLKIIAQTLGDTPIQDITRQSRSLMIWASSKRPVRTLRFRTRRSRLSARREHPGSRPCGGPGGAGALRFSLQLSII
jgi:hypothetical protein